MTDHTKALADALERLMRNFPTDTDMLEAGWTGAEVECACQAHDAAREVLAAYRAAPTQQPEPTIQDLAAGAHYPQVSAWSCAAAPSQHAEAPGFSSGVNAQAPGLADQSPTVGDSDHGPEVDWPESPETIDAWNRIRQAARAMTPGKSIAVLLSAADDFGVACTNAARAALAPPAQAEPVPQDARDAARYRVLRDKQYSFGPRITDPVNVWLTYTPEGLDQACDEMLTFEAGSNPPAQSKEQQP